MAAYIVDAVVAGLESRHSVFEQLEAVVEGSLVETAVFLVFGCIFQESKRLERGLFVGAGEVGVVGVVGERKGLGQLCQRLVIIKFLSKILHFVIHNILFTAFYI